WWWIVGSMVVWTITAMIIWVPTTWAATGFAGVLTLLAMFAGVRDVIPVIIVFSAAFALAANGIVATRGFRARWRHGVAYLGHFGAALLLIGVVASSGYGRAQQVQLPQGQERTALGYRLKFEGVHPERNGKDRVMIAVAAPEGKFEASPALFWSDYNQGYM